MIKPLIFEHTTGASLSIALLYNAPDSQAAPDEADVITQRDAVAQALKELGHSVSTIPVDMRLNEVERALRSASPALVFNLVESLAGEEFLISAVPHLLEVLGVPYTGVRATAMAVSSNKIYAKRILANNALPSPLSAFCSLIHTEQNVGFPGPYIIKSAVRHGSLGITDDSIVPTPEQAMARIGQMSAALRNEVCIEQYIDGREFNIGVFQTAQGPVVLPPAEIVFQNWQQGKPRLVGYAAKWEESTFEYHNTPRTFTFAPKDQPLIHTLIDLTQKTWRAFGLCGYARVDFRVNSEGHPAILEVNANPCLSPDSGFTAAFEHAGITYKNLIQQIVASAQMEFSS